MSLYISHTLNKFKMFLFVFFVRTKYISRSSHWRCLKKYSFPLSSSKFYFGMLWYFCYSASFGDPTCCPSHLLYNLKQFSTKETVVERMMTRPSHDSALDTGILLSQPQPSVPTTLSPALKKRNFLYCPQPSALSPKPSFPNIKRKRPFKHFSLQQAWARVPVPNFFQRLFSQNIVSLLVLQILLKALIFLVYC